MHLSLVKKEDDRQILINTSTIVSVEDEKEYREVTYSKDGTIYVVPVKDSILSIEGRLASTT